MEKLLLFFALSCFLVSKSSSCLSADNKRIFKPLIIPEKKQELLNKTLKGESGSILCMVVLPNGDLATGTKTKSIQIWNIGESSLLRSYFAHEGPINALAVLHDGSLVSASDDKTIKIWNTIDGNEIQELAVHTDNVTSLAVLSNGFLVSGSLNGIVIIWNVELSVEKKFNLSSPIKSLLVLDKDRLVIGTISNKNMSVIRIWNINRNYETVLLSEHLRVFNAFVLLPNGYLASGSSNNSITILNKELNTTQILHGHLNIVNCLALLPSGHLASGSSDKTIKIWSLHNWKLFKSFETKSEVLSFAVLTNGFLASGLSDDIIKIWNVEIFDKTLENYKNKSFFNSLNNHTSKVNSLVVLANGLLASASDDRTIKIWDPIAGLLLKELNEHNGSVRSLGVLPNGLMASGSADASIIIWNANEFNMKNRFREDREITSLAVLKNGSLIYRLDNGTIKVMNSEDGTITNAIHSFPQNISSLNCLAILENDYIAIDNNNTKFEIIVLTPNGTLFKTLKGHTDRVNSLAVLHNGLLISGSNDKTIKVWNISNETVVNGLNINAVYALSVLPNGNIAAGTSNSISIINVKNKTVHLTLIGHTQRVNCFAVLPSGYLASGSNDENEIMIWNLNSHVDRKVEPIQFKYDENVKYNEFLNHMDTVLSYVLLNDGCIASGSKDKIVKIWDPHSKQLKKELHNHAGWVWVLVALPNGYFASGSADTTIKIWDLEYNENNTLKGHERSVRALTVLPNDNLVSGSEDTTIKIWNFYEGTLIRTLDQQKHTGSVLCLISFPNGNLASGSSDETVKIWNSENGNLLKTLNGHTSAISALAILPNGNFSTASADSTIKIWNISIDSQNIITFKAYGPVYSLTPLANGDLVSGTSNGQIEFWNAYDGFQIKYLSEGENNFVSSVFSMHNKDLFYGLNDGNFKILTSRISITALTIYANFSLERHSSDIRSITKLGVSYVASASGDGEVKIWNFLDLKEVIKLTVSPTTTIPVLSIVELDFDRILVTCNNSFKIYKLNFSDRKNSEEKFKNDAHSDLIFHLLLLKNRLLLSASADQTIKVWNSTNLTDELKTLKHHTEAVKCLVELPHDRIASGSEDRTIKIWDLSSLENAYVLKTLEGHNYWIRCLAYLESLDYLASGSWDSSIYIWDLQDFTLKKTIIASDTVYSLGILKNGDLVSGSANGYIQIWNKMNLNEVKSVYRDAAAVWCFALLPQGNLAIGLANGKVDILKFIY